MAATFLSVLNPIYNMKIEQISIEKYQKLLNNKNVAKIIYAIYIGCNKKSEMHFDLEKLVTYRCKNDNVILDARLIQDKKNQLSKKDWYYNQDDRIIDLQQILGYKRTSERTTRRYLTINNTDDLITSQLVYIKNVRLAKKKKEEYIYAINYLQLFLLFYNYIEYKLNQFQTINQNTLDKLNSILHKKEYKSNINKFKSSNQNSLRILRFIKIILKSKSDKLFPKLTINESASSNAEDYSELDEMLELMDISDAELNLFSKAFDLSISFNFVNNDKVTLETIFNDLLKQFEFGELRIGYSSPVIFYDLSFKWITNKENIVLFNLDKDRKNYINPNQDYPFFAKLGYILYHSNISLSI